MALPPWRSALRGASDSPRNCDRPGARGLRVSLRPKASAPIKGSASLRGILRCEFRNRKRAMDGLSRTHWEAGT